MAGAPAVQAWRQWPAAWQLQRNSLVGWQAGALVCCLQAAPPLARCWPDQAVSVPAWPGSPALVADEGLLLLLLQQGQSPWLLQAAGGRHEEAAPLL